MSFDVEQIAAQAREHGEDELATVVGQFGGFLSVCWENMTGAGVFRSTEASRAAQQVVEWLKTREPGAPSGPKLGLATTRQLLDELRARIDVDYSMGGGGLDYTTVGGRPELVAPVEVLEGTVEG